MENKYAPKIKELENTVYWTTFGNNSRIELKNAFSIGKVCITLQKFDDNNKQTALLSAYLDADKALCLCNDILSGRLAKMAGDGNELKTVFKQQGGQPAEKANRPDKKPLYREFNIQKGRLWMVKVWEGPGKVTETGGFAADGKAEQSVTVGLSDEGIKSFAIMTQMEYQAYRTAQLMRCG